MALKAWYRSTNTVAKKGDLLDRKTMYRFESISSPKKILVKTPSGNVIIEDASKYNLRIEG